jgi:hypothetical protein
MYIQTKYSSRNGYQLRGKTKRHGYDWWWHSFVAENASTGELEPFFIEYYVINPALSPRKIRFGQIPGHSQKPSYAMIKAGKWGKDKAQIHNFWPADSFSAARKGMDLRIGPNSATETRLQGSVTLDVETAAAHPEYMSDPGTMSWDLTAEKVLTLSVGYGASALFRRLNAFSMFWHVQGMNTLYNGTVVFNGQRYRVRPETCAGYQDKNWGSDYTSPWIWLNCNNFTGSDGQKLGRTSLDVGGGRPVLFGIGLGEKVLAAFHHEDKRYEFNFSRIVFQKQRWSCAVGDHDVLWDLDLSNRTHRIVIAFTCPKETMLLVNYENPAGRKEHKELWNGGYASGTVTLYNKGNPIPVVTARGSLGGCEYGRV